MEKIEIGKIGKAQGIKGEVKIILINPDSDLIGKIKTVFVGNVEYVIENVKVLPNGNFIKLKGVDNRNAAEMLNGKLLFVERDVINVPQGAYLIADILGAEVIINEQSVGILTDVLQHGAADVYCVSGQRNFMFPALNKVLNNIDIENKKIVLDSVELGNIVVYEDEN